MSLLHRAGYGELVATTFVVLACFHALFALVGVLGAFAAPQLFNLNGQPAGSSVEALIALGIILFVLLLMDVLAAAVGAAVWSLLRRLFRGRASA